jgi:hypothetical protein
MPPQVTVPGRASRSVQIQICCGTSVLSPGAGSGDGSPGHHPGHRLTGDLRDQFIVAAVMEQGDAFPFRDGRDQQVREADRPDMPTTPQRRLYVQGTAPVLVMGRQPLLEALGFAERREWPILRKMAFGNSCSTAPSTTGARCAAGRSLIAIQSSGSNQ